MKAIPGRVYVFQGDLEYKDGGYNWAVILVHATSEKEAAKWANLEYAHMDLKSRLKAADFEAFPCDESEEIRMIMPEET